MYGVISGREWLVKPRMMVSNGNSECRCLGENLSKDVFCTAIESMSCRPGFRCLVEPKGERFLWKHRPKVSETSVLLWKAWMRVSCSSPRYVYQVQARVRVLGRSAW